MSPFLKDSAASAFDCKLASRDCNTGGSSFSMHSWNCSSEDYSSSGDGGGFVVDSTILFSTAQV